MKQRMVMLVAATVLAATGCGSADNDATATSDASQAALQDELDAVTAERDELAARVTELETQTADTTADAGTTAPGEISYGYVYFDSALAGAAFTFDLSVDAEATDYFAPVTVTEISNTGDQILGVITNDTDRDVTGPLGVDALCFAPDGTISGGSYAEQDDLAVGATGSFSIDLYGDTCDAGLVAASGYNN